MSHCTDLYRLTVLHTSRWTVRCTELYCQTVLCHGLCRTTLRFHSPLYRQVPVVPCTARPSSHVLLLCAPTPKVRRRPRRAGRLLCTAVPRALLPRTAGRRLVAAHGGRGDAWLRARGHHGRRAGVRKV